MAVSNRHILTQAPVLSALGRTAARALQQRFSNAPAGPLVTPGPSIERRVAPLPAELVRDYVRNVGGDPGAYKKHLPPHLFPQWAFPLAARTLEGAPYPLLSVMNYGCRMVVNAPLPLGEALTVSARLEEVDDDGRRAILRSHVVTGTAERADALVADFYVFVPLKKKASNQPSNGKPRREKPRVPASARELGRWRLSAKAGLDFAKLTGDFNPIHWVPGYARASGFKNVILHGFGTLARAVEGVNRGLYSGRVDAIESLDVRFTRPLVLPARVGLYVSRQDEGPSYELFVGDAPGGPAYLTGSFTPREH